MKREELNKTQKIIKKIVRKEDGEITDSFGYEFSPKKEALLGLALMLVPITVFTGTYYNLWETMLGPILFCLLAVTPPCIVIGPVSFIHGILRSFLPIPINKEKKEYMPMKRGW
jgi:hypothetical protein